ncbi:MAG: hypothetical protein H5T76_40030 [Streptomyces sp.]|nr:hypothetical protein [Streptomyces sp.]
MAAPHRLRPEDRPDFEAVLHLALNTPDIRSALSADPAGRAATRLRTRALADADDIVGAAQDEYRTYLALRASAPGSARNRPADGNVLPALAVLTPPVSASSAAILVVLGYALRLADVRGTLPGSLITAGWVLALIAATTTLLALALLLTMAIRRRGASAHPARLERARLDWHQVLLTDGMVPYLRRYIDEQAYIHRTAPKTQSSTNPPADTLDSHLHTD